MVDSKGADSQPNNPDTALTTVNESARTIGNYYFTFLLLAAYIAVTIASSTHEHFLLDSAVKLPLLGIEVSSTRFYIWAPWLFLLFHFNILLQFALLARKLKELKRRFPEYPEWQLIVFPLMRFLVGLSHDRFMRLVLTFVVFVTLILLPLWLLLWAQYVFLVNHNIWVSFSQFLAVLVDALILLLFWPRVASKEKEDVHTLNWWKQSMHLWWTRSARVGISRVKVFLARIWVTYVTRYKAFLRVKSIGKRRDVLEATQSADYGERSSEPGYQNSPPMEGGAAESLAPAVLFVTLLSFSLTTSFLWLGPAPLQTDRALIINEIRGELLDSLSRGVLEEHELRQVLQGRSGFNLDNRDLRGAELKRSVLPYSSLHKAELQGADLTQANLRKANLSYAQLQGARLRLANLQQAELAHANLQGADLTRATLNNVIFFQADLRETILTEANLQNADLTVAKLQEADLTYADLTRADLTRADLSSALLQQAILHSVQARNARLQGANLHSVKAQRAQFQEAQLEATTLTGADLQNADLSSAKLIGVNLSEATLNGARFDHAVLRIVNLTGATIDENTTFEFADIQSCVTDDIQLREKGCDATVEDYQEKLIELVCRNTDFARSFLSRYRMDKDVYKYWLKNEGNDEILQLLTALLKVHQCDTLDKEFASWREDLSATREYLLE